MSYAAVIGGEEHVITGLSPSFSSAIATIRRRDGVWILESSKFDSLQFDDELYECALQLLSRIHQVLALYLMLPGEPLSIRGLLRLSDDDKLLEWQAIHTGEFNVYIPPKQAFTPTASGSLATDVLSRAAMDPKIAEALSLIGHQGLSSWGQIYDIIEFLGIRNIRIRQTANHYRHLGKPNQKKNPLPSNPPTLREASLFVTNHLKEWIANRLSAGA